MKIISWNVNGIRAILKKNHLIDFLQQEQPDIVCLQETKALKEQIDWPLSAYSWQLCSAKRRGYSGTMILSRLPMLSYQLEMGHNIHDGEGRVLCAEYPNFYVINVYVPNAKRDLSRLPYRQIWDRDFLSYLKTKEQHKPVIVCGDFNVAYAEIDLHNPKPNEHNHGFTQEERAGFGAFLQAGFLDSFRFLHQALTQQYTWWSLQHDARARNIGWRIDYCLISSVLATRLKSAHIYQAVMGSDHCPVGIQIDV